MILKKPKNGWYYTLCSHQDWKVYFVDFRRFPIKTAHTSSYVCAEYLCKCVINPLSQT